MRRIVPILIAGVLGGGLPARAQDPAPSPSSATPSSSAPRSTPRTARTSPPRSPSSTSARSRPARRTTSPELVTHRPRPLDHPGRPRRPADLAVHPRHQLQPDAAALERHPAQRPLLRRRQLAVRAARRRRARRGGARPVQRPLRQQRRRRRGAGAHRRAPGRDASASRAASTATSGAASPPAATSAPSASTSPAASGAAATSSSTTTSTARKGWRAPSGASRPGSSLGAAGAGERLEDRHPVLRRPGRRRTARSPGGSARWPSPSAPSGAPGRSRRSSRGPTSTTPSAIPTIPSSKASDTGRRPRAAAPWRPGTAARTCGLRRRRGRAAGGDRLLRAASPTSTPRSQRTWAAVRPGELGARAAAARPRAAARRQRRLRRPDQPAGRDGGRSSAQGTRLRASYGEAFRAPSLGELFFPGSGNPDLQPEDSRSYEVGARARGRRLALRPDRLREPPAQPDRLRLRHLPQRQRRPRAQPRRRGRGRLPAGHLRRALNGTWLDAEDQDTGLAAAPAAEAERQPRPHRAAGRLDPEPRRAATSATAAGRRSGDLRPHREPELHARRPRRPLAGAGPGSPPTPGSRTSPIGSTVRRSASPAPGRTLIGGVAFDF